MRERLNITNEDIGMRLDRQYILILVEYILNVMALCDKQKPGDSQWSVEFTMLFENIKNLLESLSYEMRVLEEEEKTLFVERNAAVAEIMDPETAYSVLNIIIFS